MISILKRLKRALRPILAEYTDDPDKYLSGVRQSRHPGADYQISSAIPLAKDVGRDPVELAHEIVDKLFGGHDDDDKEQMP